MLETLRSDENGLWLKVLAQKYETVNGIIRDGGGKALA